MDDSAEIIPVLFRIWKGKYGGDVIAIMPTIIMPTILGTYESHTCTSYVHVDQHVACDPYHVTKQTRPAKPHEYEALKNELESAPYHYKFRVYKRLQHKWVKQRQDELRNIR
jgi:hypothetical protein